MSFMYKTMMNRPSNKRKIKINEENILRLITTSEEEDEEDEDFTISKQSKKMTEENDDTNDEEDSDSSETDASSEDGSEEASDSGDDSGETDSAGVESQKRKVEKSQKPSTSRKKSSRKTMSCPTVGDTNAIISSEYPGFSQSTVDMLVQARKQLKQSENAVQCMLDSWTTSLCGICLETQSAKNQRKLFTCAKCAVSVHEDCYNAQHKIQRGSSAEAWFCDLCINGEEAVCELCPNTQGCMKETKCGRWCHIVCARNILADYLYHSPSTSPKKSPKRGTIYIQLNDCNNKLFGTKECILCDDRLVSKTGICIKCDAGLCRSTFHVTCAQRFGLLSTVTGQGETGGNGEAFFANCPMHCAKEDMKRRQRHFILERKMAELKREKHRSRSDVDQGTIKNKLLLLRERGRRQRDSFFPPKPPLEQHSRLLSSDANFTRLLNNKAEKMFGISTKSPATIIPRPTEIRKRHHVVPSLTTDFTAYYADRQLRLEEEESTLVSAISANRELSQRQKWEMHKYSEIRSKLITSKFEHTDLKTSLESLKRYLLSVHQWASSSQPPLSRKRRKITSPKASKTPGSPMPVLSATLTKMTNDVLEDVIDEPPKSPRSLFALKEILPDADSIIEWKSCGICKRQDNQHLLVRCDVCKEWQHLACLDPPLTQMPKRTRFSLWQCSECAESSGSSTSEGEADTRGSFTNEHGRRLTRRSRRAPDKLVNTFLGQLQDRSKKSTNRNKPSGSGGQPEEPGKMEVSSGKEWVPQLNTNPGSGQVNPLAAKAGSSPRRQQSPGDSPTVQDGGSKSDSNVSPKTPPFGQSCDNYLSHAARLPIINCPAPNKSTAPCAKPMRNIIILKKAISLTPRRPTGLVKAKVFTPPELVATHTAGAGLAGMATTSLPTVKTPRVLGTEHKKSPVSTPKVSSSSKSGQVPFTKQEKVPSSTITQPSETPGVMSPGKKVLGCTVCESSEEQQHLVTCDSCKKTYHWRCCDPPLKGNPKRISRFVMWECSDCVDVGDSDSGGVDQEDVKDAGCTVTPDGRRHISRKRKPPEVFEPAFNVTAQQKLLKSFQKKKKKTPVQITETSARCRPVTDHRAWSRFLAGRANKLQSGVVGNSTFKFIPVTTGISVSPVSPTTSVTTLKKLSGLRTISIIQKMPKAMPNSGGIVNLLQHQGGSHIMVRPTTQHPRKLPTPIDLTMEEES